MGQTQHIEKAEHAEIDVITLQNMYKKFVTECPSGLLFLHEFKKFFGVGPSGEASEYAENMFRAFDKNGCRFSPTVRNKGTKLYFSVSRLVTSTDNTIDFLEFVAALNLVFRGDLEHKLRWSFKVYDKDGNGYIDKAELKAIVEIIYHVRKVGKKDPEASADEICERIFKAVDVDGDGQITLEEFLAGAQKDPWILNMLRLDTNPYSWVAEQRRKSAHF